VCYGNVLRVFRRVLKADSLMRTPTQTVLNANGGSRNCPVINDGKARTTNSQ